MDEKENCTRTQKIRVVMQLTKMNAT